MKDRVPGELIKEFPTRARGITASNGSEPETLRRLWVTEKVRMSLPSNLAPRPTCPSAGSSPDTAGAD